VKLQLNWEMDRLIMMGESEQHWRLMRINAEVRIVQNLLLPDNPGVQVPRWTDVAGAQQAPMRSA
jgi:hypothetical protein